MERLSYETLKKQNYQGYLLEEAPERILQFGEGKFVRSFVEHFIDILNEKTDFVLLMRAVRKSSKLLRSRIIFIPCTFVVRKTASLQTKAELFPVSAEF